LAIVTLAGKGSQVAEILNELNPNYSDICTSTTHAQNLAVRISGFSANKQRKYVTKVVEDISNHLRSRCPILSIIEWAYNDAYLSYVSSDEMMEHAPLSLMDFIFQVYSDKAEDSCLRQLHTRTNIPANIHQLIENNMNHIISLAEEQSQTHPYRRIEGHRLDPKDVMFVHVHRWSSNLGNEKKGVNAAAKKDGTWVEQVVRQVATSNKRKRTPTSCDDVNCMKPAVNLGVCLEHGATRKNAPRHSNNEAKREVRVRVSAKRDHTSKLKSEGRVGQGLGRVAAKKPWLLLQLVSTSGAERKLQFTPRKSQCQNDIIAVLVNEKSVKEFNKTSKKRMKAWVEAAKAKASTENSLTFKAADSRTARMQRADNEDFVWKLSIHSTEDTIPPEAVPVETEDRAVGKAYREHEQKLQQQAKRKKIGINV
jgi:hypothetical protein